MNSKDVQKPLSKRLWIMSAILSLFVMISSVVLCPCLEADAVDPLYISASIDETSITQVGGNYRPFEIQTTVNGGTSPFTLSFYYRVLGDDDWIQSGSSVELETVNDLPVSYSRDVYIMNSGKYQIMVYCLDADLNTDSYVFNVEVHHMAIPEPDWLIGSDKISIPGISFDFEDFTVNSEGIGVFTSSFAFVPSEFMVVLPVVVLLSFLGWWLRK